MYAPHEWFRFVDVFTSHEFQAGFKVVDYNFISAFNCFVGLKYLENSDDIEYLAEVIHRLSPLVSGTDAL